MGIMADSAGSLINGIVFVSLLKQVFAAVMATQAEGYLCLEQQIFLVRTVGEMASGTTLCPHLMEYFLFIILFLVALKASFVTLCF